VVAGKVGLVSPAIDYDELARALLRGGLAEAIAKHLAGPEAASLATKGELASRWRVSTATIDRMVRQGMPIERVTGDAPRFDVAACDGWRHERSIGSPSPREQRREDVDMDGVYCVSGGGRGGR
jgi:hypothetical protein